MDGFDALKAAILGDLSTLEASGRRRHLRPSAPASTALDLTHNDYLNLRCSGDFRQAVARISAELLPGAGASRLLGGEHPLFAELEAKFAEFKGAETALLFPSGYSANEAVAQTLALPDCAYFSDELNHASIIDGIRLSKVPRERRFVYPHGDLMALESMLKASPAKVQVIFTESVFSMDGDVADLRRLVALAAAYRGVLVIDEAHAIGVRGPGGRGAIAEADLSHDHLISVNTCGKALGVAGALVAGPNWFRSALINRARAFIFTTAPSPWLAAALMKSLDLMPALDSARSHLATIAATVRQGLKAEGLMTGASTSHIIPIIVGPDAAAVAFEERVAAAGILVRAVRPPTVPEGTARLRLSLHAGLSVNDALRIVSVLVAAQR